MGNKTSKLASEDDGHPALYYKGMAALKEGRYSISELYFHKTMRGHPGRVFWSRLEDRVTALYGNKGDKEGNPKGEAISRGPREREANNDAFDDASKAIVEPDDKMSFVKEEVELPLDTELQDTINFIRMLSDISYAYLTMGDAKSRAIAALYFVVICFNTRLFLHLLNMYREEHNTSDGGDASDAHASMANDAGSVQNVKKFGKSAKKHISSVRMASRQAIRTTLLLAEQHILHYWTNATLNYALLVLEELRSVKPAEKKRRQRLYENTLDSCEAVRRVTLQTLQRNPQSYICQIVEKFYRRGSVNDALRGGANGSGYDSDNHSSNRESSTQAPAGTIPTSGTQSHYSVAFNPTNFLLDQNNMFGRTFLCVSRTFRLTTPSAPALPNVLPLQLTLPTEVPRHRLASLLTPAEHLTLHYTSWTTEVDMPLVPGSSPYLLSCAMPAAKNAYHQLSYTPTGASPTSNHSFNEAAWLPDPTPPQLDGDTQQACVEHMREGLVPRTNPLLNLKDPATVCLLCDEENALAFVNALLVKTVLLRSIAQGDDDVSTLSTAMAILTALYGNPSPEVNCLNEVMKAFEVRMTGVNVA